MNILDKAKAITDKRKGKATDDQIILAISWMKGEVTATQACIALKGGSDQMASGNILYTFATALREAYNQGILKINK